MKINFRSRLQYIVFHTGPIATHVLAMSLGGWLVVGWVVTRVICAQKVRDTVLDSTEVIQESAYGLSIGLWPWMTLKGQRSTSKSFDSKYLEIDMHHKQRPANETQPNFARWWPVNRANNLPYKSRDRPHSSLRKNWAKNFYICSVFRRL